MSLPITGYADRISVAWGEDIHFFVSTTAPEFKARLIRPSRRPELSHHVNSELGGPYPGRLQDIRTGSYGWVKRGVPLPQNVEIALHLMPTLPASGRPQGVVTWGSRVGLFLTSDGCLNARWGDQSLILPGALQRNAWCALRLTIASDAGRMTLVVDSCGAARARIESSVDISDSALPLDPLFFRLAGWLEQGATLGCLDGKIARPRILSLSGGIVAEWDFASGAETDQARDAGPYGRHIHLVNHPRRAVTGPDWSGRFTDFRMRPSEYDAIAFHHDDMTDAGWSESLAWTVPSDLPSDVYALEVSCAESRDHIPFIVRSDPATTKNRIAFLAPSFSYLAYANEHHWWSLPDIESRTGKRLEDIISPGEKWASEVEMLSCYDRHADGTGCVHSSWLRPIVNFRAGYRHPYVMGPHQLSADLYILDWMRWRGTPFDVITDHDLHLQGLDILRPYRVVVSGSHPEYVSEQILGGIDAYIHQGGNFMYVGGNGFYCAATVYPDAPHVLELRRGHSAGLHWKSGPGEGHHASTGEPGGHWKVRGRPSQRVFGIGMTGVTFGQGKPYERTPASFDPRHEWIFQGATGDTISARADVLGGPAGFEYDRMDPALGSPPETVLLASAHFEPQQTEHTLNESRWTGSEAPNRSDVVIVERPHMGTVFAAGSIAWTSALFDNGGDNVVSLITGNVLDRFSAA